MACPDQTSARKDVVYYLRVLYRKGYITTLSGNLSVRCGDRIIITPSARPKHRLSVKDLVVMDLEGRVLEGGVPSTEWRIHVGAYRVREDVNAVVHTHNKNLIALSIAGIPLELKTAESIAYLKGGVKEVPSLPPGSEELADAVVNAVRTADVVLLKGHGVIAVAPSIDEAVNKVEVLDDLADILLKLRCRSLPKAKF